MAAPPELADRINTRLAALQRAGLFRQLSPPRGIDLSSNDYLGLAQHPQVRERMAVAVLAEGCGATGSRLLRGERPAFHEIERRFARFKDTESALYFSTGYGANIGVLATFAEEGDLVFSDELNHASIIDGLRLARARKVIFPHCDVTALARLMASEPCQGQRFLVTESLFSMDGDLAPLADYARLCRQYNCALIVDDAHAVGIYGAGGRGLCQQAFISINTAGKALGVCGAFVAGSEYAIEYLKQKARTFIFSTAPPPGVAAALDAALTIIEKEGERRERLFELTALARRLLSEQGINVVPGSSQIIPVLIGDNERAVAVAAALNELGFDVRAIRPPTVPAGSARLRVSINANLDKRTITDFVNALGALI